MCDGSPGNPGVETVPSADGPQKYACTGCPVCQPPIDADYTDADLRVVEKLRQFGETYGTGRTALDKQHEPTPLSGTGLHEMMEEFTTEGKSSLHAEPKTVTPEEMAAQLGVALEDLPAAITAKIQEYSKMIEGFTAQMFPPKPNRAQRRAMKFGKANAGRMKNGGYFR